MFFSRWSFFQGIIIILLIVLAFVADMFKKDIAVPFTSSKEINTPMIWTFLFIVFVIGAISLILYFQTKKSDTFLKHPLWDKMYVLMPFLFVISIVAILIVFLIDPLSTMAQNNRWLIYVFMYYILFFINVIVLAIIHKVKKNMITNGMKVFFSFIWSTISLFVIIYLI